MPTQVAYYEHIDDAISENATVNIPPVPENPKAPRLQLSAQNILTPHRRRTTLGSPTRQANPSLSPIKSHTNLRAVANMEAIQRKHTSPGIARPDKSGGMIKIAARNNFRGRENEVTNWDKECEVNPALEMPSPFIRRRGLARLSAGLSRN